MESAVRGKASCAIIELMTPMPTVMIELIPDTEQGGFTAHIPDIPVYGEGETEEEAIADLKVGVKGYVDLYGLEDALSRIHAPSQIRKVDFGELVHG